MSVRHKRALLSLLGGDSLAKGLLLNPALKSCGQRDEFIHPGPGKDSPLNTGKNYLPGR